MSAEDAFRELASHMLAGIMMHAELADYYYFVGLDGYARCHEYHMYAEQTGLRRLHRYYMSRYDRLIPAQTPEDPYVIPQSWRRFTRQEVSAGDKRDAAKNGAERWVNWERDTKQFYQEIWRGLTEEGEIAAAEMVSGLIMDADGELMHAKKEHLDLCAAEYGMEHILAEQEDKAKRAEELIKTLRG